MSAAGEMDHIDYKAAVDQFMLDVFNGQILTIFHEKSDPKTQSLITRTIEMGGAEVKTVVDLWTIYNEEKVKFTTPEGRTEDRARGLFNLILLMREVGVFKNNPDSLKELDFYKAQSGSLSKTVQDLNEVVNAQGAMIRKLQAELAGKGGIG